MITAALCVFVAAFWLWEGSGFFWKSVALVLFAVALPWWFAWRWRVPLGWIALGVLASILAGVAAMVVWVIVTALFFRGRDTSARASVGAKPLLT
jgi:hypothetical protein